MHDERVFQRWTSNGAIGGGNSRIRHGQKTPETAVNGWVFLVGSLNGGGGNGVWGALVAGRKERDRLIASV